MKYNILVFPCGSEIALEIHRSLITSSHVNLIGGNSVPDHGKFVYSNYIEGIPFNSDSNFIEAMTDIVTKNNIDAIFPAMDSVIEVLKKNENKLGCKVISSCFETTNICLSKSKTYETLYFEIKTPKKYKTIDFIEEFPIFMKPDIGYGSRGAKKIMNRVQAFNHLEEYNSCIILEYLPGEEFTVDCFTNFKGELLFFGPRHRARVMNGISVNTSVFYDEDKKIEIIASKINKKIKFQGAWFFQLKKDKNGDYVLLEIASRLAGSSGLYRSLGVNFALLSVFNAFEVSVSILKNNFHIEMDRSLNNVYKLNIDYSVVYIDFDDTIIIDNKVNTNLIKFLYQCVNDGKKIILITRHKSNIEKTLKGIRLYNLFDEIIHITDGKQKSDFMNYKDSIFIDDSFEERKEVYLKKSFPVFAPDAIEALLN